MIPNDKLTKENIDDFTKEFVSSVDSYKSDVKEGYQAPGLSQNTLDKMATVLDKTSNATKSIDDKINKARDAVSNATTTDAERKQMAYDSHLHREFESADMAMMVNRH